MQILATIGSGVFGGAGVEFPTFPLILLSPSIHSGTTVPECDLHLSNQIITHKTTDNGKDQVKVKVNHFVQMQMCY